MGYTPRSFPQLPLIPDGSKPSISVADEATFDAWVMLPEEDHRTLGEYAENPVPLVRRLPVPPPAPPTTPRQIIGRRSVINEMPKVPSPTLHFGPVITGYMKSSWPGPK